MSQSQTLLLIIFFQKIWVSEWNISEYCSKGSRKSLVFCSESSGIGLSAKKERYKFAHYLPHLIYVSNFAMNVTNISLFWGRGLRQSGPLQNRNLRYFCLDLYMVFYYKSSLEIVKTTKLSKLYGLNLGSRPLLVQN